MLSYKNNYIKVTVFVVDNNEKTNNYSLFKICSNQKSLKHLIYSLWIQQEVLKHKNVE